MGEEAPSAPDVAALRDALLHHYDTWLDELHNGPDERVEWLERLHLSWLAMPWIVVRSIVSGFQPASLVSHGQMAAVYRRLTSKDPEVARAEAGRMADQLLELDQRMRHEGDEPPGAWPGADRAGLEAAAEALAGYYLGGRRTDDALLAEAQAVWAELEGFEERWTGSPGFGSLRRAGRAEDEELEDELTVRYLDVWRRWLAARPGTAAAGRAGVVGPAGGAEPALSPRSDREARDDAATEVRAGPAQDLAPLRDALLRHHHEIVDPIADSRSMRAARRLRRLHLPWLAPPVLGLLVMRLFWLGRRPAVQASEDQAVRLYRQHSGKDPAIAHAEVWLLLRHLLTLDHPTGWAGDDVPGMPRADPAELEAATDALLTWYLADGRTNDPLLREVMEAWAEWQDLVEQERERFFQGGWRRIRRAARARQAAEEPIRDRYLVAWRRWLDQRERQPGATT